ncbi:MAG: hypothetical protein ACRDQ4_02765 [Pseudonocardiaceae bacterium]
MAKKLDDETARADARRLEAEATSTEPYPEATTIRRPNRSSRMFNVKLTDEQFNELRRLARQRHLPMATMARSWLLDRLEQERRAGEKRPTSATPSPGPDATLGELRLEKFVDPLHIPPVIHVARSGRPTPLEITLRANLARSAADHLRPQPGYRRRGQPHRAATAQGKHPVHRAGKGHTAFHWTFHPGKRG